MGTFHVKNTGSNTSPYSDWATAAQTLATPSISSSNVYYLSKDHVENDAGSVSLSFGATDSAVAKLISGAEGSPSGLTASTPGATLNVGYNSTSNIDFSLSGCLYVYGLIVQVGYSTSINFIYLNRVTEIIYESMTQTYEDCLFRFIGNSEYSRLKIGTVYANSFTSKLLLKNCGIKFSHADQGIDLYGGFFVVEGLYLEAGSSAINKLIKNFGFVADNSIRAVFINCDFSAASSGLVLVGTQVSSGELVLINCKMPAGWTGGLCGTINSGIRISLYNCDNGDTNYKTVIRDYRGSLTTETTHVRDGGASDGTTPISWSIAKLTTAYPHVFCTDPILVWNDDAGVGKTLTLEVLKDSATALTDKDVWMEIDYLGASGETLGSRISTRPANILNTGTALASSAATWDTTGMSNPNPQKVTATISPQQKGPIYIRVYCNVSMYVCPKIDIA